MIDYWILVTNIKFPNIAYTAYSTLMPDIITANISGYTAIVAINSVDITTASHML